jgi:transposase
VRSPAPTGSPPTRSSRDPAGLAPIPVSSGRTDRHRLDRGGNRQIDAAIHRVAVTRARCDQETIEFVARKKAEGKTPAKRSGASSATSPAASGSCCARPTRC